MLDFIDLKSDGVITVDEFAAFVRRDLMGGAAVGNALPASTDGVPTGLGDLEVTLLGVDLTGQQEQPVLEAQLVTYTGAAFPSEADGGDTVRSSGRSSKGRRRSPKEGQALSTAQLVRRDSAQSSRALGPTHPLRDTDGRRRWRTQRPATAVLRFNGAGVNPLAAESPKLRLRTTAQGKGKGEEEDDEEGGEGSVTGDVDLCTALAAAAASDGAASHRSDSKEGKPAEAHVPLWSSDGTRALGTAHVRLQLRPLPSPPTEARGTASGPGTTALGQGAPATWLDAGGGEGWPDQVGRPGEAVLELAVVDGRGLSLPTDRAGGRGGKSGGAVSWASPPASEEEEEKGDGRGVRVRACADVMAVEAPAGARPAKLCALAHTPAVRARGARTTRWPRPAGLTVVFKPPAQALERVRGLDARKAAEHAWEVARGQRLPAGACLARVRVMAEGAGNSSTAVGRVAVDLTPLMARAHGTSDEPGWATTGEWGSPSRGSDPVDLWATETPRGDDPEPVQLRSRAECWLTLRSPQSGAPAGSILVRASYTFTPGASSRRALFPPRAPALTAVPLPPRRRGP